MVVGNLAALLQNRVRRLLAYSSIAQMGYVVIALLSGKGGGYQAAAFYAIAYGTISLAAFGAIAVLERCGCGETLDDYRGAGFSHPFVSGILALAMFALAGIPPTAGFTGKFLIFTAAIRSGEFALAVIGILLAAVSVFYYLRIVITLYVGRSAQNPASTGLFMENLVLSVASFFIFLLGVWPTPLLELLRS
jgi:NADH-quinone oxidoreductase subunit N